MSFKDIEYQKKLISEILTNVYGKTKLFAICSFYSSLIETKDKNLINAYSLDFIYELLFELKSFTPFFQNPGKTETLLQLLNELKQIDTLNAFVDELNADIHSIQTRLSQLNDHLKGTAQVCQKQMLSFPLLESVAATNQQDTFGVLETFNVRIIKNKHLNKFIFIPSEKKIEERLLKQAENSFQLALTYFNNHKKKLSKFHEVLIYFDNLSASYEGNSLGIVLTVAFIERLSLIYNLPYVTRIRGNIAVTGGVDEKGNIISVSSEICNKKVELVFYSDIDTFVVPKSDEDCARKKVLELNQSYPNRQLNIVAIDGINDLLNRRNLVDIKKQPIVIRAAKGVKKNWVVSALTIILLSILSFAWIHNYDDNPFTYELDQNQIVIKNKSNRPLWEINYPNGGENIKILKWPLALENTFRILDVNGDGKNEVLFQYIYNSKYSDEAYSEGLALFNYKGKILWRRGFSKYLFSKREHLTPPFSINMYDTLTISHDLCILCASNNNNSYASAVYVLDLKENKVISDTLWSPGHIHDIRVVDLDNDGKKELFILSSNNSYQRNCLSHLLLSALGGQLPSTDGYRLFNIKPVKLLDCFLLSNSDYTYYLGKRSSAILYRSTFLRPETNSIQFHVFQGGLTEPGLTIYTWYYRSNNFDISIADDFRVRRDSLVAHGKLQPPFTDTKEYRELLRKQILAWDGVKFIPLDDFRKKRAVQK